MARIQKTESQDLAAAETIKVRLLADCALGKCNGVAEICADELDGLAGLVDAHPDAVAYAESLTKE